MAVTSRILLYESGILEQRSLPCTVVSIGNMTVGGTGGIWGSCPAVRRSCFRWKDDINEAGGIGGRAATPGLEA